MPLVGAVLLTLLIVMPGYVAWRALRPCDAPTPSVEAAAIIAATGALLTGWLAFLLASLGLLRPAPLIALVTLLTGGLLVLGWRRRRSLAPERPRLAGADWVGLAIALLALGLALRPHQVVVGGLDAGVYINTGANIARVGGIQFIDPITADLARGATGPRAQTDTPDIAPPGAESAIRHLMNRLPEGRFPFSDYLRLSGFYASHLGAGLITPQFFHLYPVWLGLAGQFTGDMGMFYVTPALAWLGAVMFALAGRRLFGAWTGNITLLVLGLNSLQIWFARHSLSEALLQFLLGATTYGWVAAHTLPEHDDATTPASTTTHPFFLALAGLALGSFALAHAQFVFAFALLPPLAIWLWLSRRWTRAYWAFFVPLLLLFDHAVLYILTIAWEYFEGLYHHVILDLWEARLPALLLLNAGLLALTLLRWTRDRWWPLATHPRLRRIGPPLLAAATGLVLAYAYLIRPGLLTPGALEGYIGAPTPPGPEATMVRLGWYLSPLGMLLAGVGAVAIVARLRMALALPLALVGIYGLAFNLASFTAESYIYSLRRFVPIVLPLLSLAAAYAATHVIPAAIAGDRPAAWRRWLAGASAAGAVGLLTLFFVYTGRAIIAHVEHEGAPEQVAAIAAQFEPTDLIIFSGPRDEPHKLATPLRFFHGLDTLVVSTNNPRGDLINAWLDRQQAQGRRVRVVMGNNGGKLLLPNYRLEPVTTISLTLSELEKLATQKAYNIQTNTLIYTIYDARPASGAPLGGLPYRYEIGPGDELATVIGWHGQEIDASGETFRWTNGDALLRLPWPAERRPMTLRLRLSGGVRPAALGPAQVTLALARGQGDRQPAPIAELTLTEDFATYEVVIPPDLLPSQPDGTVMLSLRNDAWRPDQHAISHDPRPLGARLAWLEMIERR